MSPKAPEFKPWGHPKAPWPSSSPWSMAWPGHAGETEIFFAEVNYSHFSIPGPFACPPVCIPLGGR